MNMKALLRLTLALSLLTLWACGDSENEPPVAPPPVSDVNIPETGATSPTSYPGMTLVWEEEFEGGALNEQDWTFETGNGDNGWGNNELQYYRRENTRLIEGNLVITAKREDFGGSPYTSSRIITRGKQSFQYGRIDIRAALPEGQGMWPALWLLGENFGTVGWPACGEIDIMEKVGGIGRENTIHGTAHWQDPAANNALNHAEFGSSTNLSSNTTDEYHVYSIEWTPNSIMWYVDGDQYHAMDTSPANLSEFREEFFFIINVAVGGNWPGSPNPTTVFPQHLIVDYIRVFQED
jgi:beta-glucanase (GH16 family)